MGLNVKLVIWQPLVKSCRLNRSCSLRFMQLKKEY